MFKGNLTLLNTWQRDDFEQQLRLAIVAGSGGAIVPAEIVRFSLEAHASIIATAFLAASVTPSQAASAVAGLKAKQDANQALVVLQLGTVGMGRSFYYTSAVVRTRYECASFCSFAMEQARLMPTRSRPDHAVQCSDLTDPISKPVVPNISVLLAQRTRQTST